MSFSTAQRLSCEVKDLVKFKGYDTSEIILKTSQYRFWYTILKNIEVYEEPVSQTKKSLTMQLKSRPAMRIETVATVIQKRI